jgi:fluoride ion exporter CrcB/FEX
MWEWREPFDSLLWLTSGGMVGTLARMALVELFRCYSTAVPGAGACRSLDEGALFLVLAPNMAGCFIAGLLSTPAAAGVASDERYGFHALAALPPSHRVQALTRVHVGLRTGLCGALTTWASWNQQMTARAIQGDWARALQARTSAARRFAAASSAASAAAVAASSARVRFDGGGARSTA